MMRTGPAGLKIIQDSESLELSTYPCAAGVPTIGWGHTGPDVTPGLQITRARADELLRADLGSAEREILRLVKVPLTQGQFDALVSLIFNIGGKQFAASTLLRKLNAADYKGAANEFPRWNKAKDKVLAGLVTRRERERKLFEVA